MDFSLGMERFACVSWGRGWGRGARCPGCLPPTTTKLILQAKGSSGRSPSDHVFFFFSFHDARVWVLCPQKSPTLNYDA